MFPEPFEYRNPGIAIRGSPDAATRGLICGTLRRSIPSKATAWRRLRGWCSRSRMSTPSAFSEKCADGWTSGTRTKARLYQCYLDWFHATAPEFRPPDWNPEWEKKLEELMAEQSILQRNNERWLKRHRQ